MIDIGFGPTMQQERDARKRATRLGVTDRTLARARKRVAKLIKRIKSDDARAKAIGTLCMRMDLGVPFFSEAAGECDIIRMRHLQKSINEIKSILENQK